MTIDYTEQMKKLFELTKESEAIEGFVFSALENQIEGNAGSDDKSTAEMCGLTEEELNKLWKVVCPK